MKRLCGIGLVAVLASCSTDGVGDPCAPQRPGGQPCIATGGNASSAGCFSDQEIYIETQSLQCRSRICLVYQFGEAANPTAANRAAHVYCTCRCGVPPSLTATTDQSVLCTCPEGFTCTSIAGEQYNPGVQGSYCVRR